MMRLGEWRGDGINKVWSLAFTFNYLFTTPELRKKSPSLVDESKAVRA